VLVVEDDAGIADAVVYALERDGMSGATAGSLASARAFAGPIDLAVLDLGLPDGSGFTLLHEWRAGGGPAVIVLTSRDAEVDCVAALEAGADDFVAKPFSPRALVARVRAVLRRGAHGSTARDPQLSLSPALLALDAERRTASYSGHPLALTKTEFDLLATLARAPGRVHTREQLVARVWGDGHALTERTVDTHVKALRRKLAEAGAEASLVEAVRGVGFKLREAP
jgi:two-component system catabolic regulation response regulator CreB